MINPITLPAVEQYKDGDNSEMFKSGESNTEEAA